MTLHKLVQEGTDILLQAGIEDAALDSMYLLEYSLHINKLTYLLEREKEVSEEEIQKFLSCIRLREQRIPLQHITGEQEFMGFSFLVNEHVLIPRQDTELLVELTAKVAEGKRVLDLCTGSGCILLSLAKLCKLQQGVGVDLSLEALEVAGKNKERLQCDVELIQSDLFDKVSGTFDVIVSNPPYIETEVISGLMEEVREHEPYMALDGGEDGLIFYRRIVSEAEKYLSPNGYLCFEIGYNQGQEVKSLMEEAGFKDCVVHKDLAGLDRVVMGHL